MSNMADEKTADLVSYVQNNDNLLTEANYNEVDGLIFAQMSYGRFEDVYDADKGSASYNSNIYEYSGEMTVKDYASAMLDTSLTDDQKELYKALINSPRYMNCKIHDFAVADTDKSQWAAFTVDIDDNSSVIAMRGTDGTVKGWFEDFELLYDVDGTNAQSYSKDYLENSSAQNIYLTGHSKGGNDCTSAYIMADAGVRDRVVQINNYDGPGINNDMKRMYQAGYSELADKTYNYYPKNSVIGKLLNDNPGENTYVDTEVRENFADEGIFGEHDPFSFKTDKNGFDVNDGGATYLSDFVNELLDDTVNGMSQTQRYLFVQTIEKMGVMSLIAGKKEEISYYVSEEDARKYLDAINKYGIIPEPLLDILDNKVALYSTIVEGIETFKNLPEDEKKNLVYILSLLIMNAADNGVEDIKEFVDSKIDKIKKSYSVLSNIFKDTISGFSDAVNTFITGLSESAQNLLDKAKTFVDSIKERLGNNETGGYIQADFNVNIEVLMNEAENISICAKSIREICDDISSVYQSMDYSLRRYSIVPLKRIESSARKKANDCVRLSKSLNNVTNTYLGSENKLVGQF